MTEEERQSQAGEYVLGTLSADERAAFERALEQDASLREAVRSWEERLISLTDLIPEVAPPPGVWRGIERAIGPAGAADAANDNLRLRRSRARWRGLAAMATALAAALALFIGTGQQFGDRGASYLAVVNRGGDLPALVVEVNTGAGLVTVRSVAAETPANRSLELWYIAAGAAPRSLGLVDQPRRQAVLPVSARGGDLAGATLAVSVEPPGGSKTGAPTGPVIYSGKLIPHWRRLAVRS